VPAAAAGLTLPTWILLGCPDDNLDLAGS